MMQSKEGEQTISPTTIERIKVRDGINIAVAVYLPKRPESARCFLPRRPIDLTTTPLLQSRSSFGGKPAQSSTISVTDTPSFTWTYGGRADPKATTDT